MTAVDPLCVWLLLLGCFLLVNGISFIASPSQQVSGVLESSRAERSHNTRGWFGRRVQQDPLAVNLAEHVTATLGASYVALGMLTLLLSQGSQRRVAACVIVLWSAIQLLFFTPTCLEPSVADRRAAYHTAVVCLTAAAAALSAFRREPKP